MSIGAEIASLIGGCGGAEKALIAALVEKVICTVAGLVRECIGAGSTGIVEEIVICTLGALALGRRCWTFETFECHIAEEVLGHFHAGRASCMI